MTSEGIQIYNLLKDYKGDVTVQIDGIAADAASIIAMGANKIRARTSSMIMIRRAWTAFAGNVTEIRERADQLEKTDDSMQKVYMNRFKGTEAKIKSFMENETYFTAEEASQWGFIDEVIEDNQKSLDTKKQLRRIKAEAKGFFVNFR